MPQSPLISVVVPCHGQAQFLGSAIESVLSQTYSHFELIVVNDASPDHTDQVVRGYCDSRLTSIVHAENKGLAAARNTGINASKGDYIALLDADDYFHPHKLEKHVACLKRHADVGVTYNPHFELDYSRDTIRDIAWPHESLQLSDLVMGFPFSPSDMVIRRDWAFRVGLFDESFVYFSEDLDINCRLALAGCEFRGVEGAYNYRRHHSGRLVRNIEKRLAAALEALRRVFSDPRCPGSVRALAPRAYLENYRVWLYHALLQRETEAGCRMLTDTLAIDPKQIEGEPCPLVRFWLDQSVRDEASDHGAILDVLCEQLPAQLGRRLTPQLGWARAQGYAIKGIRNIVWGRTNIGERYMQEAVRSGARLDHVALERLSHTLLVYEKQFGRTSAGEVYNALRPHLLCLASRRSLNQARGTLAVNRAFMDYRRREYAAARNEALVGILNAPRFLGNRGVMLTLLRSAWSSL